MKKIQAETQRLQHETNKKCRKCGVTIDVLTTFSGGMCVDCYAEVYETLSENQKVPNFIGTITPSK